MMLLMSIFAAAILLIVLCLRGGPLHNHLVWEAEKIFIRAGFTATPESPQSLSDGQLDFVDLLVQNDQFLLCVEVETSPRHVIENVIKANQIGLPVIILVPTRKVQKAVRSKLQQARMTTRKNRFYILLLSQLEKEVTNYFPLFSSANKGRKNRKINHGESK